MTTDTPHGDEKKKVLFVCTGNTCRSVLAEYIARKKFGNNTEYASAGLSPGSREDVKNAIFTLKHLFYIDASGHVPRDVRAINIDNYDLVIALSNEVAAELRLLFTDLPAERLLGLASGRLAQYQKYEKEFHKTISSEETKKRLAERWRMYIKIIETKTI